MTNAGLRRASKYLFAGLDKFLPSPQGPRILIYHQIGSFRGQQMEVTLDDFTFQLQWLGDNYEVVNLDTALERWEEPGSERLAVLTFDDGYEDTFTTAFPLMSAMSMPFMLYLASRQIEDRDACRPGDSEAASLSWVQVNSMLRSGLLTIGAHTHTHPDLRAIPSYEIEQELATCDDLIEQRTGVRPRHFAYPWGYWSEASDRLVNQRYESAVLGGSPRTDRPLDRTRVPRFPVQLSDGSKFFSARLTGGLLIEERLRRRVRGYAGP